MRSPALNSIFRSPRNPLPSSPTPTAAPDTEELFVCISAVHTTPLSLVAVMPTKTHLNGKTSLVRLPALDRYECATSCPDQPLIDRSATPTQHSLLPSYTYKSYSGDFTHSCPL